ncbi:MAG: hypothetical protein F4056_08625 [Chloroflexi bacterium]|nr:hypothetical protein [Chloroflexota bacterium]
MDAVSGNQPRTWGQHGAEPTGVRPGCVVGFVLIAVGLAIGIAYGASGLRGGGIDLGYAEDYALASVVYRSTDGLFVVRLPDGEVIALSDLDPHNPPGGECRVSFRPDLAGTDGYGRFFDICSGAMYDISGRGLGDDGLDLRRLPLERGEDGKLELAGEPADVD